MNPCELTIIPSVNLKDIAGTGLPSIGRWAWHSRRWSSSRGQQARTGGASGTPESESFCFSELRLKWLAITVQRVRQNDPKLRKVKQIGVCRQWNIVVYLRERGEKYLSKYRELSSNRRIIYLMVYIKTRP